MDVKIIHTKTATITVEIDVGAAFALESYLEQRIGFCALHGYTALGDKCTRQHEDIRNALDMIREHQKANQ